MLQAMNTGHDGALTTVHANSPRRRLCAAGNDGPYGRIGTSVVRDPRAGRMALDLIVEVARLTDGARRVTSISEVTGMEGEVITVQEIFRFKRRGISPEGKVIGVFEPTGVERPCS